MASSHAAARGEMPFIEHLRELRRRLIISLWAAFIGFIVCYYTYDIYVGFLTGPLQTDLYMGKLQEGFTMRIRISLFAGIIFTFPLHLYNIVAFILPALTGRERRILGGLLGSSFVLFLIGGYVGYFQILPISVDFLKKFVPPDTKFWLNFRDNLQFVLQLILAFVIMFQLPLVMVVLMAFNVVSRRKFLQIGRYFIVILFILSALLTPPDIVSQIGLAVPLILLYYLAILVAKIGGFGAGSAEPDSETIAHGQE